MFDHKTKFDRSNTVYSDTFEEIPIDAPEPASLKESYFNTLFRCESYAQCTVQPERQSQVVYTLQIKRLSCGSVRKRIQVKWLLTVLNSVPDALALNKSLTSRIPFDT